MSWLSAVAVVFFVFAIGAGALLSVRIDRRRQSRAQLTQYQPNASTRGLCACVVPARRALRIEPSDALKDVG